MAEVCVLADGRRVKFSLKRRDRDPYFLVCFEGPDGKRKDAHVRARVTSVVRSDSAVIIIRNEYDPHAVVSEPLLGRGHRLDGRAHEGREPGPNSISTYETVLNTLGDLAEFVRAGVDHPGDGRAVQAGPSQNLQAVYTVRGDINELSIIFGKWFVETLKLLSANP